MARCDIDHHGLSGGQLSGIYPILTPCKDTNPKTLQPVLLSAVGMQRWWNGINVNTGLPPTCKGDFSGLENATEENSLSISNVASGNNSRLSKCKVT